MHWLANLLKPGWRGIWTGIGCTAIVWYLTTMGVFIGMEDWMLDGAFITRGTRPTKANVVIIGIDNESLRKLNKSTHQLSPELAKVVRHAHAQGAAAIGVDLLVPQDMSFRPDIAGAGSAGDARPMGAAIRDCGNVVLPRWPVEEADGEGGRPGWMLPLIQWQLKASDPELGAPTDLASISLHEDGDQFVRRVQLLSKDFSGAEDKGDEAERPIVHFALALYLVKHRQDLKAEGGVPIVNARLVPEDARGMMKINYVGPPGTFPTVPFHEALAAADKGEAMPRLKGAVVLIGVTDRTFQDYHATPYANHYARWVPGKTAGRMSGTEVQANAYATLEDEAYIRAPSPAGNLALLLLFGVTMGYSFYRAGLAGALLLATIHHFLWKAVALALFIYFSYRVPVVGMLLLGVVLYGATFALRWQQARRMMKAFMASAILTWFENDPSRIHRKGEEREVTVLFADIRDFSVFSDGRDPKEVARLLMAYFDVVVPVIESHGGALNQYMGDGMMVLFGATDDQPDHAVRAARAAVEVVRAVRGNAELWAKLGKPDLRIGVGINTGVTVVGSIGAQHLMDFTAIGDTTNIAARIEALNKELKTEVLVSENTWREVPEKERESLGCEPRGRAVHVKGKKEPLVVHVVHVPA